MVLATPVWPIVIVPKLPFGAVPTSRVRLPELLVAVPVALPVRMTRLLELVAAEETSWVCNWVKIPVPVILKLPVWTLPGLEA